jgi:hypothetical protein
MAAGLILKDMKQLGPFAPVFYEKGLILLLAFISPTYYLNRQLLYSLTWPNVQYAAVHMVFCVQTLSHSAACLQAWKGSRLSKLATKPD